MPHKKVKAMHSQKTSYWSFFYFLIKCKTGFYKIQLLHYDKDPIIKQCQQNVNYVDLIRKCFIHVKK